MAEVITMPRLSDTMTEGKVVKWHFSVGDEIKEGDILAEIETDKAIQDFESEFDGTLLYQGVAEGESAMVDSILTIIGEKDEDFQHLLSTDAAEPVEAIPASEEPKEETSTKEIEEDTKVNVSLPKDTYSITMPRLSDTMEEGTVVKWNFNVGDSVKEGDILAEIETDKAVQDFESEYDGTLLFQGVAQGKAAPVDSILAIIGPSNTDVSDYVKNFNSSKPKEASKEPIQKENATAAPAKESVQTTKASKTPTAVVTPSSNGLASERVMASPVAKKMAEDKGININQIMGSGENGRVVKRDIENFTPGVSGGSAMGTAYQPLPTTETPNSQVRNIIAKRLSESKFTAPHYYLTISLDMEPAMQARASINSIPDTKISFNDMILKAAALGLRTHRQVNSSWEDDRIIHHGDINIGMAVAIEDGLVVPVIKNTDTLTLAQISATSRDMAGRARERKLKADEMEGSTFSVSNLGMLGIESFTSIINQPNTCIMSVGAIEEKPVVREGKIVIGYEMKVTLACDHRVVDGATGAEYLQTFKDYMENPIKMFM